MKDATRLALLVVPTLLLSACAEDAGRNADGEVVSSGNIDVFHTKIGDCFNDQSYASEIDDVPGVPCSEPHDNEVYALFDTSLASFPGEDQMFEVAFDECLTHFKAFVGASYEASALDVFPIVPTLDSWKRLNDREVVCALYHVQGEKLVGTMRNTGI